jgi:hypothetical protein
VGIISAAWGAVAHLPAWRSLDDIDVVAIHLGLKLRMMRHATTA